MPPKRKKRHIREDYNNRYFKPQGVPLKNLVEIEIFPSELEALRLKYIEELNQEECGQSMKISRQTVQRTLKSAVKKITEALINGYALKINSK